VINKQLVDQIQQRTADGFYTDRANYIHRVKSGTQNAAGQHVYTDDVIPMDCSFTDKPDKFLWTEIDFLKISFEIRFGPTDPKPEKGDLFELTSSLGVEKDNPDRRYRIVAILDRGLDGYVVGLEMVSVTK